MIKIIATDMDGTLLDENANVPEEFYKLYEDLNKKDIKFIIASGRSYTAVTPLLKNTEKMDLICDNGACLYRKGKLVSINKFDPKEVTEICNYTDTFKELRPFVCGTKGNYRKYKDDDANKIIEKFYKDVNNISDYEEIDDEVFKISIADPLGSFQNSFTPFNRKFGNRFTVQVSGEHWLDIMVKDINKGTGLKYFKKVFNVKDEEVMAFGDYFNDVPLLDEAKYSYVMENAVPEMKEHGRFIAPSNKEQGVLKVIKEKIFK